jgi:hypothetical protein
VDAERGGQFGPTLAKSHFPAPLDDDQAAMGNPGQGLQNQASGQAIEHRHSFGIHCQGQLTEKLLVAAHR